MIKLFKLASDRHDEIVKNAFVLQTLGKAAMGLGKAIVTNPLRSLGAALTGDQVLKAGSNLNKANQMSKGVSQALDGTRSFVG